MSCGKPHTKPCAEKKERNEPLNSQDSGRKGGATTEGSMENVTNLPKPLIITDADHDVGEEGRNDGDIVQYMEVFILQLSELSII